MLDAFGEGAAVVSRNAARYGSNAGTIAGLGFTIYSFLDFAQKTETFQASTMELGRLEAELRNAEAALQALSDQAQLQEFRRHCAQAVIEELSVFRCADPG